MVTNGGMTLRKRPKYGPKKRKTVSWRHKTKSVDVNTDIWEFHAIAIREWKSLIWQRVFIYLILPLQTGWDEFSISETCCLSKTKNKTKQSGLLFTINLNRKILAFLHSREVKRRQLTQDLKADSIFYNDKHHANCTSLKG